MQDLPEVLREYRVRIVLVERAGPVPAYPSHLGLRSKFGGTPDTIQGGDGTAVDCPACGRRMHFVAPAAEFAKLKTIVNPRLVVEVLSESTEADDRGAKFDGYRKIPTLEQNVLVAQDHAYVPTFTRQFGGGWLMMPYIALNAVVPLSSIGVDLPSAEIYAGVSFSMPTLPQP